MKRLASKEDGRSRKTIRSWPLAAGLLMTLYAAKTLAGVNVRSLVGTSYATIHPGDSPIGIKEEASAIVGNGKSIPYVDLSVGRLGEHWVLWAHKVKERNARGVAVGDIVTDATETAAPAKGQFFAYNCRWTESKTEHQGAIGLIDDRSRPGSWLVLKAWTVDPKTEKIKTLSASKVGCAPEGD